MTKNIKKNPKSIFITFNQTNDLFCCGLHNGFKIINCDPFEEKLNRTFQETGISKIEILNRSNVMVFVGDGTSTNFPLTKVFLWDDYVYKCILKLEHDEDVLGVKINLEYIFTVTKNKAYIHNSKTGRTVHTIETYPNQKGLLSICSDTFSTVIAIPGLKKGSVRVRNFSQDNEFDQEIIAHEHEIEQIQLNSDGSMIATASEEGTLIRVIESQTGKEIKQFRRGAKKAKIYSLAFDENSEFLAATSSSGTIHIFRLTPKKEKKQSEKKNKRGETGTERSVMKTKIPNKEYCVCGFDKSSNLFVVTIDGSFYKFYVDKANRQIKQVKEMYKQFLNIHDEKEKEK